MVRPKYLSRPQKVKILMKYAWLYTIPLSEGVNLIKVQTENETKTFKLMK